MIRTRQLGISLLILLAGNCFGQKMQAKFLDFKYPLLKDYCIEFKGYCELDTSKKFENIAVEASFFGDYKSSIKNATKAAKIPDNKLDVTFEIKDKQEGDINIIREKLEKVIENEKESEESKKIVRQILESLDKPKEVSQFFKNKRIQSAKDFITNQAESFHFVLINEAHYSSQNRAFTKSLLMPLWNKGFRYLALETIDSRDSLLNERGYPLRSSGFYSRDPVFGNMIREALKIGFKIIAYETLHEYDGTLRDKEQAENIYNKTWKKDTVGKVLIHAGYGHIFEIKSSLYEPMAYQLKKLSQQDILSIDQVNMKELDSDIKMNDYYRYFKNHYSLEEPSVFIDTISNEVLRDNISKFGIDIQLFHPPTKLINGRPSWQKNEESLYVELHDIINSRKGSLIQVFKPNEQHNSIPIDQFIIGENRFLILEEGAYLIKVIDSEGTLVITASLEVKK